MLVVLVAVAPLGLLFLCVLVRISLVSLIGCHLGFAGHSDASFAFRAFLAVVFSALVCVAACDVALLASSTVKLFSHFVQFQVFVSASYRSVPLLFPLDSFGCLGCPGFIIYPLFFLLFFCCVCFFSFYQCYFCLWFYVFFIFL